MPYDIITQLISNLDIPFVFEIARIINNEIFFAAFLLLLIFIGEKDRRIKVLFGLLFVFLIGLTIKELTHIERPCVELNAKISCPDSLSFPSNHVILLSAVVYAFWNKRSRWLYAALLIFVAFTRLYLGVHTLLDVVGGFTLGICGYALFEFISKQIFKKNETKI